MSQSFPDDLKALLRAKFDVGELDSARSTNIPLMLEIATTYNVDVEKIKVLVIIIIHTNCRILK